MNEEHAGLLVQPCERWIAVTVDIAGAQGADQRVDLVPPVTRKSPVIAALLSGG